MRVSEMDKKLYDLMDWAEIEAIVYSEHDHPETVLGVHKVHSNFLRCKVSAA